MIISKYYRYNSFIVDFRHKFTVRNMNEVPVFVQSSGISNRIVTSYVSLRCKNFTSTWSEKVIYLWTMQLLIQWVLSRKNIPV